MLILDRLFLLKIATTNVLKVRVLNSIYLSKKVKIEAVWVLSNAVAQATQLQKAFLHEKGVLDCFISFLGSSDKEILKLVLEGILNFVKGGEIPGQGKDENPFKRYLEENYGFDIIIKLQKNNDENVSKLAKEIINTL